MSVETTASRAVRRDSRAAGRGPSSPRRPARPRRTSAEAAALVRPRELGELQPAHRAEQRAHLVERPDLQLARLRQPEPAQPVTADVHRDASVERRAQRRDRVHADLVVQVACRTPSSARRPARPAESAVPPCATTSPACCFTCTAQLPDSTMMRSYVGIHVDESRERRVPLAREARVGRRLAAARGALGNVHLDAEPLEHRQRRDRDLRIELVDVAGDEQRDGGAIDQKLNRSMFVLLKMNGSPSRTSSPTTSNFPSLPASSDVAPGFELARRQRLRRRARRARRGPSCSRGRCSR